jgi:hypothetical protein
MSPAQSCPQTKSRQAGLPDFFDTIYQNEGKYTKLPQHYQMAKNVSNDRKIFQMTVKYSK